MSKPPPPQLSAERPVRSDFSQRGLPYSVRRAITLTVLAAILLGGGIWLYVLQHATTTPGVIPEIKAEGSYKQRPVQPGGLDIPHQDVEVYKELDAHSNSDKIEPENIMPPAEAPQPPLVASVPVQQPAAPPASSVIESLITPSSANPPIATTVTPTPTTAPLTPEPPPPSTAPVPAPSPTPEVQVYHGLSSSSGNPSLQPAPESAYGVHVFRGPTQPNANAPPPPAAASTSVSPVVASVPVQAVAASSAAVNPSVSAPTTPASAPDSPPVAAVQTQSPPPHVAATPKEQPKPQSAVTQAAADDSEGDGVAVQLASIPDEAAAKEAMQKLQNKYASILGSASLRLVRADLGDKGVYYRIQSQPVSARKADSICQAVKRLNAGCILVRH